MVLYLYRCQDLLLFLFCADLRFTRYNISNFATKHILSISIAKNLREFTSLLSILTTNIILLSLRFAFMGGLYKSDSFFKNVQGFFCFFVNLLQQLLDTPYSHNTSLLIMKFTNFLASTLMVSAAYSAVVPTKSEEIHVDKRTQYTLQGLVSELLTHAVVDTASLFGHAFTRWYLNSKRVKYLTDKMIFIEPLV